MSSLDSVYFSPNPGTYAVIRIDPVAMVEELKLDDAEALSAAKAMHTKSYLICLDYDLELPFPGRPWYGYGSYPVAPCLRPEEPDRGLTSDMSVAIYPNQNHPTGRPPVHPEPAFPYGNCYHWVSFSIDIRVRARPELFDESRAVNLPPKEQVEMDCYFGRDLIRAAETKRMRQEMLRSQTDEQAHVDPAQTGRSKAESFSGSSTSGYEASRDSSSSYSTLSSEDSVSVYNEVDALMAMNIFGAPDQDVACVPLVDLWLDLTDHLKEEDIPNPLGLLEERDAIVKIIRDARSRTYAALNARPEPHRKGEGATPSHSESGPCSDASSGEGGKHRRFRPLKLLRKLRTRVKAVTSRYGPHRYLWQTCMPYVPVWP